MSKPSVRILVAEDEPMIAHMIEEALVDEGLNTTVAHSGEEAVGVIQASSEPFQVLVTDIRVGAAPDGWALAQTARASNPALGVIYITGDSMAGWRTLGVPDSVLIAKPFVPAQIVGAVTAMLKAAMMARLALTSSLHTARAA
jgi:CheY-like chemotaxis protein